MLFNILPCIRSLISSSAHKSPKFERFFVAACFQMFRRERETSTS